VEMDALLPHGSLGNHLGTERWNRRLSSLSHRAASTLGYS
jgi:hypothetical protein